jgi:hypothetical protein
MVGSQCMHSKHAWIHKSRCFAGRESQQAMHHCISNAQSVDVATHVCNKTPKCITAQHIGTTADSVFGSRSRSRSRDIYLATLPVRWTCLWVSSQLTDIRTIDVRCILLHASTSFEKNTRIHGRKALEHETYGTFARLS